MKKLKVTLADRPVDVELAQYKRMFEAACSALGAIGDALGVDPEEGGAEPILAAIAELKAAQDEPVAWRYLTRYPTRNIWTYCADEPETKPEREPLYTRPQAREPLTGVIDVQPIGYHSLQLIFRSQTDIAKFKAAHGIEEKK